MIPNFNKYGYLPPGNHTTTWEEFELRFAYNEDRQRLILGLKAAADNLKRAGCRQLYVDGSFVTSKPSPNDWDACWELDGVDFTKLDSTIVDEKFNPELRKARYFGDLFLNAPRLPGHDFANFFRKDRSGMYKGLVVIDLATFK
jgi:hypothetical protein